MSCSALATLRQHAGFLAPTPLCVSIVSVSELKICVKLLLVNATDGTSMASVVADVGPDCQVWDGEPTTEFAHCRDDSHRLSVGLRGDDFEINQVRVPVSMGQHETILAKNAASNDWKPDDIAPLVRLHEQYSIRDRNDFDDMMASDPYRDIDDFEPVMRPTAKKSSRGLSKAACYCMAVEAVCVPVNLSKTTKQNRIHGRPYVAGARDSDDVGYRWGLDVMADRTKEVLVRSIVV